MHRIEASQQAPELRPECGRARLTLALLCLAGMLSVGVAAGCGQDDHGLPDDAVARVGDRVIARVEFERAARGFGGPGSDPRDRAACVAAKRREANGKTRRCEVYQGFKNRVMDYL